ncbi:Elongation factor Ts [Bienertia sinuspersici]
MKAKDNFLGVDEDKYLREIEAEDGCFKKDFEDESPLSLSDDEEDTKLELGQLFQKVGVLRKALFYYSCQTHTSWSYCHNEPNRLLVKCKIQFLKDVHNCTPTMKNKRVHSAYLAEEYQKMLLKHPTLKLKLFIRDVKDTYDVKINRWQDA